MMTPLYLSRARLRSNRGEVLSAIAPILFPDDEQARPGHAHRLVWLLFQDIPDIQRDFLWRDDGDGKYLILSPRVPTDRHNLFELDTKPFAPELAAGDRLRFSLRTNPTVARKDARDPEDKAGRARGKRVDVVMDALCKIPKGERAVARDRLTADAGQRWLTEQGARTGFKPHKVTVNSYARIDIADTSRKKRRERAGVSVMDLGGELEVTDPAAFVQKLAKGFGAAKAFGNGLMLIRRA